MHALGCIDRDRAVTKFTYNHKIILEFFISIANQNRLFLPRVFSEYLTTLFTIEYKLKQ